MGKIYFLFCFLIFWSCSDTPSEVPIDSYRTAIFNVNMNNVLNDIYSIQDTVSLIINGSELYEMKDDDEDNILSVTIPDLILGQSYI